MNNITIKDIAKFSGYSKATVSRVINNSGYVSQKTRETITKTINKFNYSPSAVAVNLSKQITSIIGVIVPEVDNPFFGEILRGIVKVVDENNMTLICCNTDDNKMKDIKALEMLKNHRVCGLIYTPAIDYGKQIEKVLKIINTPVVLLDRPIESLSLDGVYFDDYKAMYDATKALIDAGHNKIGIINGTLDRVHARIRQEGYIKSLLDNKLQANERHMFFGDYSMTKSYEFSKKLLAMPDRPTAVITCNNRTSMGFLKALQERGESLQKDIACIGLDRIEALDIMDFPFNYIKRDSLEMGEKAMRLLIDRMAFPNKKRENIILDAPIIIIKL